MSDSTYGHEGHTTEPTPAPVVVTDTVVVTEPVTTVTVTPETTKADKAKAVLATILAKAKVLAAQARVIANEYAYEVFVTATVILVALFALLYPYVAIGALGVVAAASGWIAYYGLRKRVQSGISIDSLQYGKAE